MKNLEKKIALLLVFIATSMSAQMGVGTRTPHPDAMLEVATTNKGILLPRVALTATTAVAPLSAHVVGMTVYNTATAGDVSPGYYYNDGSKWVKLATGQGLKGDTGEQGPVGPAGPQGDKGDIGLTGPAGAQGLKGDKGDIGLTGPAGAQGLKGDKGDTGATGPQGIQGLKGDKGDIGLTGPQGIQGLKGDKGDTGATGPQGIQGLKGDKGDTGAIGAAGPQGPAGAQGLKGDKGDTGAAGSNATVTGTAPISVASGVVSLTDSGVSATKLATDAVETSKIKNAAVTVAKISATGTASATTFLRGDGAWVAPSAPVLAVTEAPGNDYTVQETDAIIYRNLTGNGTITFPASLPAGKVFYIANTSGGSDWAISPMPVNQGTTVIYANTGHTVVTLGGGQILVTSAN